MEATNLHNVLMIDINNCARCGKNHKDVLFRKFVSAPVVIATRVHDFWGMCPTHKEPILMEIVSGDEEE